MLSWQRIPARNQELLMCKSKAHPQFALMPQILLGKSLNSTCYFFPLHLQKYTCVPSSHFSPFSLVTSMRMNLGGRPGRLPGPNLLFPRPRPRPLALQNTECSKLDTKKDGFGFSTDFMLPFSASLLIHSTQQQWPAVNNKNWRNSGSKNNGLLAGIYLFCPLWETKVQNTLKFLSVIMGPRGLLASIQPSAMASLPLPTPQFMVCWKHFQHDGTSAQGNPFKIWSHNIPPQKGLSHWYQALNRREQFCVKKAKENRVICYISGEM